MMGGEVVLESAAGPDGRSGGARRRADIGRPSRPPLFSRENAEAATVSPMRAGALAAVSIVAAGLGAAAARGRLARRLDRR